MTNYLNLIEIKDLKDKLEGEKIHGKVWKDTTKKEKNEIKNNTQIYSDVNDKIKNDLSETKENYVTDKYNLENRNLYLEAEIMI